MPSKNGIFSLPQTKIFPGRNIYDRIYMIEKLPPSLFIRKGDAEHMYELDHPNMNTNHANYISVHANN